MSDHRCQFHPDADTETDEVVVSIKDQPDSIYEGKVCSVCGAVLAVGEHKRDMELSA